MSAPVHECMYFIPSLADVRGMSVGGGGEGD